MYVLVWFTIIRRQCFIDTSVFVLVQPYLVAIPESGNIFLNNGPGWLAHAIGILCLTVNSVNNASACITLGSLLLAKKCSVLLRDALLPTLATCLANWTCLATSPIPPCLILKSLFAYHTVGMGITNGGFPNNREFHCILRTELL